MIKLIALHGNMGVGKSEAYKFISETLGKDNVVLVKFAQPLYDIQEYAYNIISPVYTRPDSFTKDRKLLQWLGTEWGRQTISESVWIDLWKSKVKSLIESGKTVVCDDVRFPNEAESVRQLEGIVININSYQNVNRIDTNSGIVNHPSESGLPNHYIDDVVYNNGTLEEYKLSLTLMLKGFKIIT